MAEKQAVAGPPADITVQIGDANQYLGIARCLVDSWFQQQDEQELPVSRDAARATPSAQQTHQWLPAPLPCLRPLQPVGPAVDWRAEAAARWLVGVLGDAVTQRLHSGLQRLRLGARPGGPQLVQQWQRMAQLRRSGLEASLLPRAPEASPELQVWSRQPLQQHQQLSQQQVLQQPLCQVQQGQQQQRHQQQSVRTTSSKGSHGPTATVPAAAMRCRPASSHAFEQRSKRPAEAQGEGAGRSASARRSSTSGAAAGLAGNRKAGKAPLAAAAAAAAVAAGLARGKGAVPARSSSSAHQTFQPAGGCE
eukprot:CAMPEP_0115636636 /NCGR_PEP_ID=MMETSP0272-20121206/33773_1 /TAXON_ID=71861 /ORGANISM="Scrippsiella trochoidea, Strain CCMP3099" /LENGTH=306 /DNA_ID=CAMNT_0003073651 /DNA_START=192 /DNA_END=1110 /DNA_ORIENTATION=-